jgi:hypothetical protein
MSPPPRFFSVYFFTIEAADTPSLLRMREIT